MGDGISKVDRTTAAVTTGDPGATPSPALSPQGRGGESTHSRKAPRWDDIVVTPTTGMHRNIRDAVTRFAATPPAIAISTESHPPIPDEASDRKKIQTLDLSAARPLRRGSRIPDPSQRYFKPPTPLVEALRSYLARHPTAKNGFSLPVDMGRAVVEKTFREDRIKAVMSGGEVDRVTLVNLARVLANHHFSNGKEGVAEAILDAMDLLFGHRLLWDRRLSVFEWMTPGELVASNPAAIRTLRAGKPVFLVGGRLRYFVNDEGHLFNPVRIETNFTFEPNGPPYVELKREGKFLVVTDAEGTNSLLIAKKLGEAGIARWSDAFTKRVAEEESFSPVDEPSSAAIHALNEGLRFYLEREGGTANAGITLPIDTGTETVETRISGKTIETLRSERVFLKRNFIPLAQGLLTYLSAFEKGTKEEARGVEIAATIIATFNRQFGHRLEWDWRLGAFKTLSVTDILATDPRSAEDLAKGEKAYLGAKHLNALLRRAHGFFLGGIKLVRDEPNDQAPCVTVKLRDGKLFIYEDEGHGSILLAKTLVEAGVAELSPFYKLMRAGSHEALLKIGLERPNAFFEAVKDYYGDDLPSEFWIVGSKRITLNIESPECPHMICQDFVPGLNQQWVRISVRPDALVVTGYKGDHGRGLAGTLIASGLAAKGYEEERVGVRGKEQGEGRGEGESITPVHPHPDPLPSRERGRRKAGEPPRKATTARPAAPKRSPAPPTPARLTERSMPPVSERTEKISEALAWLLTEGLVRYQFQWKGDESSMRQALLHAGLREWEIDWFVNEIFLDFVGREAASLAVALTLSILKANPYASPPIVRNWVTGVMAALEVAGELEFSWEKTARNAQIATWLRSGGHTTFDPDEFLEMLDETEFSVDTWLGRIQPQVWQQARAKRRPAQGPARPIAAAPGITLPRTPSPQGRGEHSGPGRTKAHAGLLMTDGALALVRRPVTEGDETPLSLRGRDDRSNPDGPTGLLPLRQAQGRNDMKAKLVSAAHSRGLSQVARFLARLNETQLRRVIEASTRFDMDNSRLSRTDRLLAFVASRITPRENLQEPEQTGNGLPSSLPPTVNVQAIPTARLLQILR